MAQTITVLGIDLAKLVFHIVGMDDSGHVVLRKRLTRSAWLTFIANVPPPPVSHTSIAMDCPEPFSVNPSEYGKVIAVPEVGGLHHHYERWAT